MLLGAALLACAVGVAPTTMDAIVRVESKGDPLALHVNRWTGEQPHVNSVAEGVNVVRRFVNLGYSVDIGYGQLNTRNLDAFGYSIADAFDGCKNLRASGMILASFYAQAVSQFGEGQRALMSALSGYNTGSLVRGFSNGYVARYYVDATLPVGSVIAKHERAAFMPWFDTVAYDRPGYGIAIQ